MAKILLTIDRTGKPTIEAQGFEGGTCTLATQGLVKALSDGKGQDQVIEKPEMYNTVSEESRLQVGEHF